MSQTETLEQFIAKQLESGSFETYDEMVAEGLRLLQERIQHDEQIATDLAPAYERAINGAEGIKVNLDEVKRLSELARAQKQTTS